MQQLHQEGPRARNLARTLAFLALAAMTVWMLRSSAGDSITMDEDGDIAAGYSYLKKGDLRLNSEHPPLIKDLAALPLLWMNLNGPWTHPSWAEEVNGTLPFAKTFLFHSGNDLETILQAARKPMILLTVLLGLAQFLWTQRVFGSAAALLATACFAFSPTFLAHGRLVTNDVGSSAGFFLATIAYLRVLARPGRASILLAGLALGFALLVKFSTLLLLPLLLLLTVFWVWLGGEPNRPEAARCFLGRYVLVVLLAFATLFPVYWHHTRNYPPERQKADTAALLTWFSVGVMHQAALFLSSHDLLPDFQEAVRTFPRSVAVFTADKPGLRAYSSYLLGLFYVLGRSKYGNTKYYLGEVSGPGTTSYFPFVYLVKEPLAMHLLSVVAAIFAVVRFARAGTRREWLRRHFTELALVTLILVYWLASIRSNLNLGVRHLLPTLIPVYVLLAVGIVRLYASLPARRWRRVAGVALAGLLVWHISSVVSVYPHFLAYFNELAGGPEGGYRYVADSNLDWGQDLKRLAQFTAQKGISELSLDYFGRAEPQYYLAGRVHPLQPSDPPRKGWIAVSASAYLGSREEPGQDYRRWLPLSRRVAAIGHSIFVFYLE